MAETVIAVETLTRQLFDDILPLARKGWAEGTIEKADTCAWYGERDFDIDPDFEQYEALTTIGALVLLTMRHEGKLVGYVTGTCWKGMHHRHFVVAQSDSMYVEMPYRGHVMRLVRAYEKEMVKRGAVALNWLTHPRNPLFKILLSRGYVADETMLEKRVAKEVVCV